MATRRLVLVILLAAARTAGAAPEALVPPFQGRPAWLLLGEVSRQPRDATARAAARRAEGVSSSVVRSDHFVGLRPGLFVVVYGAAASRQEAQAAARILAGRGVTVDVKASGEIRPDEAGAPQRLLLVRGRLDAEQLRTPAQLEIEDERVYTDREGVYEAWVRVGADEAGELELVIVEPRARRPRKGCMGWMDKSHLARFGARDQEVTVSWSPSPDCCDR